MAEAVNKEYVVRWCFLRYGRPQDIKFWKTSAVSKEIAVLDFRCWVENALKVKREGYRIYDIKELDPVNL